MFFKKLTIQEQINKNKEKLIQEESKMVIRHIDNKIKDMVKDLRFSSYLWYEFDLNFEDEICSNILQHFKTYDYVTVEHKRLNHWNNEFSIKIDYKV